MYELTICYQTINKKTGITHPEFKVMVKKFTTKLQCKLYVDGFYTNLRKILWHSIYRYARTLDEFIQHEVL